jgi:hypothetical protein
MPKIRMRTTMAGPDGVTLAGHVIDVTAKRAKQLVPKYAERLDANEKAVVDPGAETATAPDEKETSTIAQDSATATV